MNSKTQRGFATGIPKPRSSSLGLYILEARPTGIDTFPTFVWRISADSQCRRLNSSLQFSLPLDLGDGRRTLASMPQFPNARTLLLVAPLLLNNLSFPDSRLSAKLPEIPFFNFLVAPSYEIKRDIESLETSVAGLNGDILKDYETPEIYVHILLPLLLNLFPRCSLI